MDEDELEMLSEARARLANTQGKKAKRKAREKQLEEARRLASLQKRRELRAAGIGGNRPYMRKRKRGVDYNAEIPFEKKPALGFYNTAEEQYEKFAPDFNNLRQQNLEGEMRTEKEERERKKDKERLKQRQENEIPAALLKGDQPAKLRSKLVLPEPQISDRELEQVVKLGKASEAAQDAVREGGQRVSDALLADYSLSQASALRTPRTLAPATDRVLQEAQNLMALTNVETPLKGGTNAPLINSDFSGVNPSKDATAATPNTILATPFRTPKELGGGATPGAFSIASGTPRNNLGGSALPGTTPLVRDRLNINAEDALEAADESALRGMQLGIRDQLKRGLSSLPTPKNDYEIVVPEDEMEVGVSMEEPEAAHVEDQADIDSRTEQQKKAQREAEFRLRSQAIQRDLPRPAEVNSAVLRPQSADPSLNDMQRAEELIKREMLTMVHYDGLKNPVPTAGTSNTSAKKLEATHNYLKAHPYQEVTLEELAQAKELLSNEMETVKTGMGHGDLSLESYCQVWDECLSQVLYVPSQTRYTRASLASKKDRLEALERRLETNRKHMAHEAKRASRIEKKLRTLTAGYQSRATALMKQAQDLAEQVEMARLELDTYGFLRRQEDAAIPRRLESLSDDVAHQAARERELQHRYLELTRTLEEFYEKHASVETN
uniref:EOG090X02CC n=1 Tax=Lynceus sp. MCZ IZ 141354 TaxID=1930659 RepID=A0A9N6WTT4_9CRUS|nr:EOG090X02CC [Lynceus sp. MCZ IZ 141354]